MSFFIASGVLKKTTVPIGIVMYSTNLKTSKGFFPILLLFCVIGNEDTTGQNNELKIVQLFANAQLVESKNSPNPVVSIIQILALAIT